MVTETVVADTNVAAGGAIAMDDFSGKDLPKCTLVSIDIDTTGRRLIDEIVQLAAYTPGDHFEQYIMPYMNLNPAARQRHQVRVISIGFYRMLKSMQTYKIIKSKSEIAALKDFLDWLEALKAKDAESKGVILIYHEERKFIPYMILESVKKYNLLDRFRKTVKSFANAWNLAKIAGNDGMQHYSLRKLSKMFGPKILGGGNENAETSQLPLTENNQQQRKDVPSSIQEPFDGSASVRAKLVYEVALQMSNKDKKDAAAHGNLLNAMLPFAIPIREDLTELQTQNENLERQNSFRPVFLNYFKTTLYHRVRAVKFRIILAENGYDLAALSAIWTEKSKAGIQYILQPIAELKPEEKEELAELLDSFFDPTKQTIRPVVRGGGNRRRNRRNNNTGGSARGNNRSDGNNNTPRATGPAEHGAGGDKQNGVSQQLPDTTTTTTANNNATKTAASQPMANANNATGNANNNNAGNNNQSRPQRPRRFPRSRNSSYKRQQNTHAAEMQAAVAPTTPIVATAVATN